MGRLPRLARADAPPARRAALYSHEQPAPPCAGCRGQRLRARADARAPALPADCTAYLARAGLPVKQGPRGLPWESAKGPRKHPCSKLSPRGGPALNPYGGGERLAPPSKRTRAAAGRWAAFTHPRKNTLASRILARSFGKEFVIFSCICGKTVVYYPWIAALVRVGGIFPLFTIVEWTMRPVRRKNIGEKKRDGNSWRDCGASRGKNGIRICRRRARQRARRGFFAHFCGQGGRHVAG